MNFFRYLFSLLILTLVLACSNTASRNNQRGNSVSLDTLQYEMKIIDRIYPMQFHKDKDTTIIKIAYPFFDSSSALGKNLNDTVRERIILGKEDEEGNIIHINYHTIEDFVDSLLHEYKLFLGDSPISIPWYNYSNVEVLNNTPSLLSLKSFIRIYLGGMHEDISVVFDNFDTKSGKRLTIDDIFKNKRDENLLKIGEFYFKETRKIAQDKKLTDLGIFNAGWSATNPKGGFYFNDNFLIDKNYLIFYYNEYEISSYSFGTTELKIPLAEIRPYLKDSFKYE